MEGNDNESSENKIKSGFTKFRELPFDSKIISIYSFVIFICGIIVRNQDPLQQVLLFLPIGMLFLFIILYFKIKTNFQFIAICSRQLKNLAIVIVIYSIIGFAIWAGKIYITTMVFFILGVIFLTMLRIFDILELPSAKAN